MKATFNFTDRNINESASIIATNNSNLANISNLTRSTNPVNDFMTLEHNINILDGTLSMLNLNNDKLSYLSASLSDDNAICQNQITFNLSESYTLPGITFEFGAKNCIYKLDISYTTNGTIKKYTVYPNPDSSQYIFKIGAENVSKIVVSVLGTRFPRMFTRIQSVFLGIAFHWDGNDIIECRINESIHPISNTLNVNTCSITVYSESDEFNLMKENNFTKFLNKNSEFYIYGEYEGKSFPLGKYYLDTWDASHRYEVKFNLISPLGMLDKSKYENGGVVNLEVESEVDHNKVWRAMTLGELVKKLMDDYNKGDITIPYRISDTVKGFKLVGKTTFDTYRNVLQLICFCSNVAVDDTRDGIIKIFNPNDESITTVDSSIIFDNQSLTENEKVTGILLTLWSFDLAPDGQEQFISLPVKHLNNGQIFRYVTDKIICKFQYKLQTASNWQTVYIDGKYLVEFTASQSGDYEFRLEYTKEESNIISYEVTSPSNNNINNISIENAFLVTDYSNILPTDIIGSYGDLNKFKTNTKKYYSENKYTLELELFNNGTIKTGRRLSVPLETGGTFIGTVVEQVINASEGMISHIKMVGDINAT